ncbi:hypothetical protein JCM8097_001461 [Rhodosporidiobolus ruineniae]
MPPLPSPFSHSAPVGGPPHPSPLPSPSLSPSIASLLSSSSDQPAGYSFEPHDYFQGSNPQDVFPSTSRTSPSPSHPPLPSSVPSQSSNSFSNLLAPDPAYSTDTSRPTSSGSPAPSASTQTGSRPRSSHKRPRPTSSGSLTSLHSADGLSGANGTHGAGGEEEEGAMEPPTSRVRRSSSTSSTSASAATASSSAAQPSSASSSRAPPPPPPPAPTAAQPAAPPMQRRQSDLPLEPSIFNVEPIDEFTREVADWLWGFCAGLDWDKVEIEAKIGLLVDHRAGGSRMHLPVPIETILTDDTGLRFQSNMTINQHKAFNRLLNSRVEESAAPTYPYATVRYAHTRELDTFHEVPPGRRKVRVTRDQKDKTKPASAVEKVRVADMNIFSPKRLFDWRLSVSLENPAPVPDTPPTHSRYKDRISYTHQLFTVDLTQVSSPPPAAPPGQPPRQPGPPTHELEIEFRNARVLLEEAAKEQRGEEGSRYLEMVQGLLNNVRMLIRNASDP